MLGRACIPYIDIGYCSYVRQSSSLWLPAAPRQHVSILYELYKAHISVCAAHQGLERYCEWKLAVCLRNWRPSLPATLVLLPQRHHPGILHSLVWLSLGSDEGTIGLRLQNPDIEFFTTKCICVSAWHAQHMSYSLLDLEDYSIDAIANT